MTVDDLADLLRARDCDSLWYFHTDHFEPWSFNIDDASARAVDRMAVMARSSRFAQKLSLFYAVFVPYWLEVEPGPVAGGERVDGDGVAFGGRLAAQEALAAETIRPLVTDDGHEIHLHVHHEFFTRNGSAFDNPVSQWVNACSTAEADLQRLELYVRLCVEAIARETGRPFERWAFVHGNWALNASDPDICHVDDEMAMLMRQGGFGDFSFPAGRSHCDARLQAPFTCLPMALPRAYDDPAADPRALGSCRGALREDRFFIWNSPLKGSYSSLDYYSQANRDLFRTPERILAQWLTKSVALDRCLFLKTHAHSMNREYRLTEPEGVIPHCYPDVVALFDLLERVCERARVELRPVTVREVMARLRRFDASVDAPPLTAPLFVPPPPPAARPLPRPDIATVFRPDAAGALREHVIETAFTPDGGSAWYVSLPPALYALSDSEREPSRSPLVLCEDGVPLGPPHSLHAQIREEGGGRYSFYKTGLWLSVPDGSDPNRNGRVYSILPQLPRQPEAPAATAESIPSQ
ncbi:MAG: hypothetical protein ACM3JG_06055 [Thiohalocapsa sp.]